MAELSDENRERLAAMIGLHQHWERWQADRVATLLWAADLVDRRVLTVAQCCTAFGVSQPTWYRHMKALRPVAGSELEREAASQVEAALRGAGVDLDGKTLDEVKAQIDANPDLELALAGVGVWRTRDQGDQT